jgi:outer membrane protein OmpA-like peptidoglycan-associated protein
MTFAKADATQLLLSGLAVYRCGKVAMFVSGGLGLGLVGILLASCAGAPPGAVSTPAAPPKLRTAEPAPAPPPTLAAKEPICPPNSQCFDGCNWSGCDENGNPIPPTAMACNRSYVIRFQRGTSEPVEQPLLPGLAELSKLQLANPERSLLLVGYAKASEVASEPLRQQLAQRRAERARKQLIEAGISAQRLQIEVASAERSSGGPSDAPVNVQVDPVPSGALRSDYDPSSREYQYFCVSGGYSCCGR